MTKRSQYLHIHYTDISPPEPVAPVRGVAGLQGGQPTPGHIPASEQEQQVSPTKANPEAAREAVEHHVPPPREGQVGSHSVPVVRPGQDRDGETIWKWQVTNLSSCHLEPPPRPVRSQAQQQSLKFTTCRAQVADLPSSVMGCCFYFPFIGKPELLPVVTVAIKLLWGLRFTYQPRDLQGAHREGGRKGLLQSN